MEHSKRHISPFWNFTSAIKDVFWIKNCTLQTLIPESFKNSILAGLLTYSIFLTPFPSLQSETVDLSIVGKLLAELTAAGLFRIYTWFPFHHSSVASDEWHQNFCGKDTSNRNKSEENSNENKNKLIISPIFATREHPLIFFLIKICIKVKSPISTIALLCLFFLASCISRNKTSQWLLREKVL